MHPRSVGIFYIPRISIHEKQTADYMNKMSLKLTPTNVAFKLCYVMKILLINIYCKNEGMKNGLKISDHFSTIYSSRLIILCKSFNKRM